MLHVSKHNVRLRYKSRTPHFENLLGECRLQLPLAKNSAAAKRLIPNQRTEAVLLRIVDSAWRNEMGEADWQEAFSD